MKFRLLPVLLFLYILALQASAGAAETLMLYTSLPEVLSGGVAKAFMSRYPDIRVELRTASSERLAERLAAELESGAPTADILWTEDVFFCYRLKSEGAFFPYVSPGARGILNTLPDFDGSFTPGRYAVFGFAAASDAPLNEPRQWRDLSQQADAPFGLLSPTVSNLSYVSSAIFGSKFGWRLFGKNTKVKMFQSRERLFDETASGALSACFAEDLAVAERGTNKKTLTMTYPNELVIVPSPAGILRTSNHRQSAKKFIDFMLSPEGQGIVAECGTLPVSPGTAVPERFGLPSVEEAAKRAVRGDYVRVMNGKEALINEFISMVLRRK